MNYYNEWDSGAASWIRELINQKLIPYGYVDERSITEVTPSDLEGFTQCHFFAGIGGWPLALQLAGVSASTRLWTGSPPCQPFSVAGQSLGFDDERHLAPAFLRLIRECKPKLIFGEQVAAAIGKHWLDFVFLNLEEKGYACGAAVLPACSVGAPHKRDRLFFGASQLAYTGSERIRMRAGESSCAQSEDKGRREKRERIRANSGAECINLLDGVADTISRRRQQQSGQRPSSILGKTIQPTKCELQSGDTCAAPGESTIPHHGFWSDADWLGCRDGKFRPVEPGAFPLANGIPARVGRLRGYGNAIVPQAAAEFVKAFFEAREEAHQGLL